jgi:integrase
MSQGKSKWRLDDYGLDALPTTVADSHGMPMDVSGESWRFNDPTHDVGFDFGQYSVINPWLSYSLKRHLISCIKRVSPIESYNTIRLNLLYMSRTASWQKLTTATDFDDHEGSLNRVMSEVLALLRAERIEHNFNRIRAWYSWCADFLPGIGFLPEEAYKWQLIRVPGNEKGVAVRTSDPEGGPLSDAELVLLRRALQRDDSKRPKHIQQRAALWLALVFGRNPSNFCQLRREDLQQVDPDVPDLWTLSIPRIKKRARPRAQFKKETVDRELAEVLHELIQDGPQCEGADVGSHPMFARSTPREGLLGTAMDEWAWHMTQPEFTELIQAAIKRYGLISPRTNEPLFVTTRRMRYTFATNRVREGISARDLAEALDHSTLDNVRVYFEAHSTVVERLDRAAASEIAHKLALFVGQVKPRPEAAHIGSDPAKMIRIIPELISKDHHIRDLGECGKGEFCNLFPPYSCYPCDKFEAFDDSLADHEKVFDFLIERRERLRTDPLESTRIAVQLDEVIYACADLILRLRAKERDGNGA